MNYVCGQIEQLEGRSLCSTTTPTPALAPPAAPTDLVVVTRTQWVARLAFTDQSTDEGQFVVERASAAGPDTSFREVQRISGSPPGEAGGRVFYSDPTGGGIFAYRVRAANAAGVSEPSNTVTITVSQGFEFGFGGVFFND